MADSAAETTPDENRGPEILAVCGSLVGLAMVVVALRMWVRARIVQHIGADDWTILGAMVCLRLYEYPEPCGPHLRNRLLVRTLDSLAMNDADSQSRSSCSLR